jgi:hypothetical protein
MLGVLTLAKKHGPAVVDEAAKAALDLGVPTYRFLRRYRWFARTSHPERLGNLVSYERASATALRSVTNLCDI